MDNLENRIANKLSPEQKFETCLRGDSDNEVRSLFKAAQKRKEDKIKYKLLAEALQGKCIDLTKSNQLYEAVNREKMEFEQLLKLHPEEVEYCKQYIKQRREEMNDGKYWNPHSQAKWAHEGTCPPCCYFARPKWYWQDKRLRNNFLNMFPAFRVSTKPL